MVGLIGIEPMTSTMSTWRSNQLSYNPLAGFIIHIREKNASTFFRFRQFDKETMCFFLEIANRRICSAKPYRQSAAAARLSASLDPRRTTQKENSIYSLRQKNSSKLKLPSVHANSRSSLLLQNSTGKIKLITAHPGMIPRNRGHVSAAFQHSRPHRNEAVNISGHATERRRLNKKPAARSIDAG